jgi:transposase
VARPTGAVRRFPGHPYAPHTLEPTRRLAKDFRASGRRRRQRIRHDRFHDHPRPPAQCRGKRGDRTAECIGRSNGGLTTKIHARGDALGNPTGFHLTPGQAHDLEGAAALLPDILETSQAFLADKAYDAQERVLDRWAKAGVTPVIPPKSNRTEQREYDKDMYKARHLIENFFAKLKQYRAIATRYDKRAHTFLGAIYLAASVIWLN